LVCSAGLVCAAGLGSCAREDDVKAKPLHRAARTPAINIEYRKGALLKLMITSDF